MHISGKLFIVGLILFIVFSILTFVMPMSIIVSAPSMWTDYYGYLAAYQTAGTLMMVFGALSGVFFIVFLASLIYYIVKGRHVK